MQKFESTRNKIGFQYSWSLNELYVRELFVPKFHTSVVTLKIQSWLWTSHNKHCTFVINEISQFTNLPDLVWAEPPMIKYSPLCKIADTELLTSFKSPILFHSLFWNRAMMDVLNGQDVWPIQPPKIYAAESVDATP